MATVAETQSLDTLADLLESLGGISAQRIPLRQELGRATEQDVIRLAEMPRRKICELVDGVLVEKAMGFEESCLASSLIFFIHAFVMPRKLGVVSGEDGFVKLWPGRVRIPDVAFIAWDRFPGGRIPSNPIPEIAPNLVVEVLSRTNTKAEMLAKRRDYFQSGVELVWEFDVPSRSAVVYTQAESPDAVLGEDDTITGGEVLPGFELPLATLFASLLPPAN